MVDPYKNHRFFPSNLSILAMVNSFAVTTEIPARYKAPCIRDDAVVKLLFDPSPSLNT
jgi:hypothetical protein